MGRFSAGVEKKGVTMLELMVVLALLTLLSGTALIGYTNLLNKSSVSGEAQKIESALGFARGLALQRNAPTRLVFITDNEPAFWVDEIDENGLVTGSQVLAVERIDDLVMLVDVQGDNLPVPGNSQVAIRFYADGSSDNAKIHLINRGASKEDDSEYTTIKVYGPTGRSRVFANQKL